MKEIAKTLTDVFKNPVMQVIMDREQSVMSVANDVLDWWRLDLFSRKPAPALLDNGKFQGTDLDLSTFMMTLADRGAVINLPKYKSMRGTTLKEGQTLSSKDNRHGKIIGLTANQKVFTFGIRIIDANIMTTDTVGEPRNFNLVDIDGEWYPGWENITFMPNTNENDFIKEFQIEYGNKITFSNFVSQSRKNSIFGAPYFITKVLIDRLTEEVKYLKAVIDDMIALGIRYPKSGDSKTWPKSTSLGNEKSVKVKAFEVEIDGLNFQNEFPHYSYTQKNLKLLSDIQRDITYHIKPMLIFATRSCELAYKKYGNDILPDWIKGAKFQEKYKTPKKIKITPERIKGTEGQPIQAVLRIVSERTYNTYDELIASLEHYNKRLNRNGSICNDVNIDVKPSAGITEWDRLILFQPKVGEYGISIRKRDYMKSERVSDSY